jgi:putative transcriptional regulator
MPVTSLAGQMLIAMPQMQDRRFERSVILLCAHNEDGAMGLVINKLIESLTLPELLIQLGIDGDGLRGKPHVHFGGPVESGRGFVLHSDDYSEEGTINVGGHLALTATLDILRAIGRGDGPRRSLLALGYAGWGPGQLEEEIQRNSWLSVSPDEALLFGEDAGGKWRQAMAKLNIDPLLLSDSAGHA